MNSHQQLKVAKYAAPIALLAVAMLTFTGVAYAYTATYTDSFDQKDVSENYYYIIGGTKSFDQVDLAVVSDTKTTSSVTDRDHVTFEKVKFVKKEATATGDEITELTYTLDVTLYDAEGNAVTGMKDRLAVKATPKDITKTGAVTAVNGVPTITIEEKTSGEPATGTGVYTVTIVLKLVTPVVQTYTDYVVPGYDISVVYKWNSDNTQPSS